MLDPKIENAINEQVNAEIYSSLLYYSMSAYFESLSLKGFAHWLRVQALEELTHVQKFFTYIHERGGQGKMMPVEGPPTTWESPLQAFEAVYAHEVLVTGRINDLMTLSLSKNDHATTNFLQWFVGEQVEEESTADEVVQRLKLVDRAEAGLFFVDQEMDKRTFIPTPDMAGVF